ncbi:hypothetical protein TWF481_002883 [Arthrobotrys musiformis]|uniref:Uncharacterized protein n=1 Tax=Arthrobotrys musiformis TaxID=47236 RepID=A0AAV9VSM1_9PEZI
MLPFSTYYDDEEVETLEIISTERLLHSDSVPQNVRSEFIVGMLNVFYSRRLELAKAISCLTEFFSKTDHEVLKETLTDPSTYGQDAPNLQQILDSQSPPDVLEMPSQPSGDFMEMYEIKRRIQFAENEFKHGNEYDSLSTLPNELAKVHEQSVERMQGINIPWQRHDRILVPLDNICYDCPVGINERTGEVGNLCLDRVTPAEGIQQFRIHGVFKEYGSTKPIIKTNANRHYIYHHNQQMHPSVHEEFPPATLFEPQWQYHYGDPFLLRPEFRSANTATEQRDHEGVRKINVFNLRTGEPLSVPLTKLRLHPNYKFKGSEIRSSQNGLGNSIAQFRSGQLLTVAVLGGRNVRLGGRTTSSLLFCLATETGAASWVLENQLEPLDTEFMSFANHTSHWLISDMDDETQVGLDGLCFQDRSLRVVYANFRNSTNSNDSRANYRQEREKHEDESEDGDIQSRGRLSPNLSSSHGDGENPQLYRSRGNRVVLLQRTRQSSTSSEVHERRRAHLDPSSQGVLVDSTPIQSEGTDQRGRNVTSRLFHHTSYPEEQPARAPPGLRPSRLAPPLGYLNFLEERLFEEGASRFFRVDGTRYSSRERDLRDSELEDAREESPYGGDHDALRYGEALTYMRARSNDHEAMDREHSNSRYSRNHPWLLKVPKSFSLGLLDKPILFDPITRPCAYVS